MRKKNNSVLVTGGAGYIGSKIVTDLIKFKYKVIIIDNLSTGSPLLINKKAKFYKCNLSDEKKLQKIFEINEINYVIHCAASLNVKESQTKPKKYFNNNVRNTRKLLRVFVKNKIKFFIFSSSCTVYGNQKKSLDEKLKPNPVSVYGKTKYECEKIIHSFSKKNDFKYIILRFFNVAGSDIKNKIGHVKQNDQLIKNLCHNFLNKKKIYVYGRNYKTQDGTCIRDYMHLNDISYLHCKSLKLLNKINKSEIINCGYGIGFSVLEIISNFEKIIKKNIKFIFLSRRSGDMDVAVSNVKKMKKIFKLKYNKKNTIHKILKSALDWEKIIRYKKK